MLDKFLAGILRILQVSTRFHPNLGENWKADYLTPGVWHSLMDWCFISSGSCVMKCHHSWFTFNKKKKKKKEVPPLREWGVLPQFYALHLSNLQIFMSLQILRTYKHKQARSHAVSRSMLRHAGSTSPALIALLWFLLCTHTEPNVIPSKLKTVFLIPVCLRRSACCDRCNTSKLEDTPPTPLLTPQPPLPEHFHKKGVGTGGTFICGRFLINDPLSLRVVFRRGRCVRSHVGKNAKHARLGTVLC